MITQATSKDFDEIIQVWELSVRATHDFLPEEYLQEIKSLLPSILPQVELYVSNNDGKITGFLGVADKKIEMLFIHPDCRGKGIGRSLMNFAITELNALQVDVNEQNDQAVQFYMHLGFEVKDRTEVDGMGRPFPLLKMELPCP